MLGSCFDWIPTMHRRVDHVWRHHRDHISLSTRPWRRDGDDVGKFGCNYAQSLVSDQLNENTDLRRITDQLQLTRLVVKHQRRVTF